MRKVNRFLLAFSFLLFVCFFALPAFAENPGLTICTQNLHNFGIFRQKKELKKHREQRKYLVKRFVDAQCDIIAFQELYGNGEAEPKKNLNYLVEYLKRSSKRNFTGVPGKTNSPMIRNGFIYDENKLHFLKLDNYYRESLPKLNMLGPSRNFLRGPVGLTVQMKNGGRKEKIKLITFHLKSKSDGWKDPAKLQYETTRMEMAEAIRTIVERESKPGEIVVVLGDKNSADNETASQIFKGRHHLDDYRALGRCSVNADLLSVCSPSIKPRDQTLISLFATANTEIGQDVYYSYVFRKKKDLIDDVFVGSGQEKYFRNSSGKLQLGMIYTPKKGSDHNLLWVRML